MELRIRVDHYIHADPAQDSEGTKLLRKLLKLNTEIMGAIDDVKAALAKSNEKIDIIVPAVAEVRKDITFIKAKLEAQPGGIDAAGVAELLQIANDQDTKLGQVATDLQALDAETDSSGV